MRFLLPLLLITALLSGCVGETEVDDIDGQEIGSETTDDNGANQTSLNTPPVAVLAATTDGLRVTFTINVTDADGDPVAWTLDADGDGEADAEGSGNETLEHTYPDSGVFNATVVASDGIDNVSVALDVQVIAPEPPLPGQTAEGSFAAGGMLLIGCFGSTLGVGFPEELDGVFYASFAIEPHTIGYDYEAAVTTGTEQDSPGFAFLDADWGVITSGFMSTHASGQVPGDAAHGVWWTCAGGDMSGSYASTPPA